MKEAAEQQTEPIDIVYRERKILSWVKNNSQKLFGIFFICIIVAAMSAVFKWTKGKQINRQVAKFANLVTIDEQLDWANEIRAKELDDLKGFIFIKAGNDAFLRKDYQEAFAHYEKAIAVIKLTPLLEQAQFGYIFSAIYSNQLDKAKNLLTSATKSKFTCLRAQAYFILCSLAQNEGDMDAVARYKEELKSFPDNEILTNQLRIMQSIRANG